MGLDRFKTSVMYDTGPISTPKYRDASGGVSVDGLVFLNVPIYSGYFLDGHNRLRQ